MAKIAAKEVAKKVAVKKVINKIISDDTDTKLEKIIEKAAKFVPYTSKLKEGMKAPNFNGLNQEGKQFGLSDYKGKKLILYFYPKDNTPGCTAETCNLQDNLNILKKEGFEVVGVSADDAKSHKKFADKFKLGFNLLADTKKAALKAYDVYGKKMFMGKIFDGIIRTTFIIDEQGTITNVIRAVNTKDHANQIRNL